MTAFFDIYPQQTDLSCLEGRLIGLAGKARRGKGTAGITIKRALPRSAEIASAEPLKAFAALLYDLRPDQLDATKDVIDPRYNCTPRKLYQTLGQAARQNDGDVWISLSLRRAAYMIDVPTLKQPSGGFAASWTQDRTEYVIIGDVRYLNEAHAIRQAGGFILLIEGPERSDVGSELPADAKTHESERDMELPEFKRLCEATITNDATREDFDRRVSREIREALKGGLLWRI